MNKAKTAMIRRFFWLAPLVAAVIVSHVPVLAQDPEISPLSSTEILLRLYDATLGLRWTDHTNWLQTDDPCGWHGISCYDGSSGIQRLGSIEVIDLSDNHLVGSLPKEIFDLPYLKTLILRDNVDLHVSLDNIESAQELRYLVISNTQVESLDNLEKAPGLNELHITNLQLKGSIPSQIFTLTALTGLFANFNAFTGSVPTQIGHLTNLHELYLYENRLGGQIPTQIGLLTELRVVAMARNMFLGTLPVELNLLTNLEILSLQRDFEQSKDPGISGPLPALDQLSQLTEVYLEYQMLTGSIPEFFIQNAPKDEGVKVDLTGNQLIGSVPTSLSAFLRLNLFLEDNEIQAINENFCSSIGGWMGGKVETLGCSAFLCPPGFFATGGRETDTENCEPCVGAAFAGATYCSVNDEVDERNVLINLYNACGGRFWKDDLNWLDPSVNICKWHGIVCNNDDKVIAIVLNNNDLINTPPNDLFTLPELREINLNSNNLDFKFAGISKATNLKSLDLTHTDLTSLANIEELDKTSIATLKLASNILTEMLPVALFSLSTLTEVELSHNKFSGPLPTEIGTLGALVRFECYGNKLTGQIPSELGKLGALTELSIAENAFNGTLPSELNALTLLEILSIHQTTTPEGIGGYLRTYRRLGQLKILHLNSNKLTGTLPTDFLATTARGNEVIDIQLGDNLITGTVPASWGNRFNDLRLDLTGNRVTGIADELCGLENWMDGAVGDYRCDAILCPIGTYNEFGRQTAAGSSCRTCIENRVMGATSCAGEVLDQNLTEIDILSELFYNTGGNSWKDKEGWMSTTDYCNWSGILCNSDGSIIEIDLNGNRLTGTPPKSIFKLSSLTSLDLRLNQIDFIFEGIGDAANLASLFLSDTDLNSIKGIGAAKNLEILHLTDNDLTGTIPDDLFQLPKLKQVFLNYNRLSGRIPQDVAKWSNLEELYLLHNRLTGQIPAAIGSLKKLKILALTENLFTGSLPDELNDLTSIEVIAIQREEGTNSSFNPGGTDGSEIQNARQGIGLRGPLPSFNRLTNLTQLYLGVNQLTGTIPFDFLDGVVDKTQQIDVDLIANQLTGTVPASLTQFGKLALYLAGNKAISHIAEGICLQAAWMTGDVGKYGCDGFLCSPDTFSRYGREHENDACQKCPGGTKAPYYGSFDCVGDTEGAANNERAILTDLFLKTDGYNWATQTNWLDPTISICEWYGITCTSDSTESVSAIVLSRNNLNGTIPSIIFTLPNITEINFSFNTAGIDFDGIGNATNLEFMNLDGMGLTTVSGIEGVLNSLKLLHIGENNFNGTFPEEIKKLSKLEALYMTKNEFSGEFPSSVTLLSNMVFFSCGNCGLHKTVPTLLGTLSSLQYLSLEENSFTGKLPAGLNNLTKLKHLDLSDQISAGPSSIGLTGNLPDFASMTSLTGLYLYRNAFTGHIPSTFLDGVTSTEQITVDLRINNLNGSIPSELSRFTNLNIFLADNEIDSIPSQLCNLTWNGAIVGSCNNILCAQKTFNSMGRATANLTCEPCDNTEYAKFYGSTQCIPVPEKEILDDMFIQLNGQDWTSSDGWRDEDNSDICKWHGVTCNGNNSVQSIVLQENSMVGTLPPSIFELKNMQVLDLRNNEIDLLNFTAIETAASLESLDLSQTKVTSLAGIGSAPALTSLRLTANDIAGKIPDELFSLTMLRRLYLNYNMLTSTFPTQFGALVNLEEFFLFHNNLTGSIPSDIGKLSSVRYLGLGENRFSGVLPTELNSLTNLRVLSLQRQTGSGATGTQGLIGNILPFNNANDLRELYLGGNQFNGSIPSDFLEGITDHSETVRIDLTANKISGSIPSELSRFDDLKLFLAGNAINNIPENLCMKGDWMDGEVQKGCDALLCFPGFFNAYGRRVSDEDPCVFCGFNSSTEFFGSVSCGTSLDMNLDERSILFNFYNDLAGKNWTKKDGWEEDKLSICKWHGISCLDDVYNKTVTKIDLSDNGLVGTVPPFLFRLPNLKTVILDNNKVDFSFEGIGLAPSLEELDAHTTNMTNLKGIAQLENLRFLSIEDNNFDGQDIPEDIFFLSKLERLHMSNSGFGGTLSTKIGQLVALKMFYCHQNGLSGEIPSQISHLSLLQDLELSNNYFFGTLPTSLNKMTALKLFYIRSYRNKGAGITGPLLSFSGLQNLRDLDLGSNTLTGSIPQDFLNGIVSSSQKINVILKSNKLTGAIPTELGRFSNLILDLADNKITEIDPSFCSQSSWNDGAVAKFSCQGILCPPGSFNDIGRQSSASDPCVPCTDVKASIYFGAIVCTPVQKKAERVILELLYQLTGGVNWKRNDHWLDHNVDICEWYGVSCSDGATIESLLLGANNLDGTVPKQIFDLPNLKYLWLYSNPITFSFDSIENAKHLVSMLLNSINLKTLDGIGKAVALLELDVRFNSIQGTLSSELEDLKELTSLSCSNNMLTGRIPSFSTNRMLNTLRLENNKLTGTLTPFASNADMLALDLSGNLLTGTIPPNFLASCHPSTKVTIDLSRNMLTGTVPGELARLTQATIYLRDNALSAIAPELCQNIDWNEGDVGAYQCNGIMCAPGFFSPGTGRTSKSGAICMSCEQAKYYGASCCGNVCAVSAASSIPRLMSAFIVAVVGLVNIASQYY